ncbi:MAG: thioredoxin family protein [Nitrospirae bacterium]|nr:thioredoxin family protein [Nitrospirota bacterium]
MSLKIGDPAPAFSLPGTDGRTYSLDGLADKPVLVVVFSCNHCPYVQAYEDRLIAIQRDYVGRGVQVVAINSNDDANYPEDSFEQMMARAQARGFNFVYLRDASQAVARAYGATHTPQLFVFDRARMLRYTGKIDDNWQNPQAVTRRYLRDTLDALLSDRTPAEAQTHAIGCTIKWK